MLHSSQAKDCQLARQVYQLVQQFKVLLPYIPEGYLGSIQLASDLLLSCQLECGNQKLATTCHRFAPNKKPSDETCLDSFSAQAIIFCCCCHFEYTSLLSFLSFISDLPFYVHILYLLRVNNNVNTVNTAQYSRIYDNLIRTCIKSTSLMGNFLRAFFVRLDFEDVLRFNQRIKTCIQLFRNFFKKSWLLP